MKSDKKNKNLLFVVKKTDLENFSLCDYISDKIDLRMDQFKGMVQQRNFLAKVPTEDKLVILIDIVNFSKNDSKTQFADIIIFQRYVRTFIFSRNFSFGKKINIENFVPTGDGCYMIAAKCDVHLAVNFLITMIAGFQNLLDYQNKPMGIRCSALIGECIPFMDLAIHKNFVGEGMNEAARVLTYGQEALETRYIAEGHTEEEAKAYSKNSLFLGQSLYSESDKALFDGEKISDCHLLEAVADKHGKKRDILVLRGIKKIQ
ncbi:MAG: hypothetical protein K6G52_00075 [Treponemataceae bacterium]|nr:hypothetical protein [Treponemataceae bacterium]